MTSSPSMLVAQCRLALDFMVGVLANQSSGWGTTDVEHRLPVAQPHTRWPGRCQVVQHRQSVQCTHHPTIQEAAK